MRLLFFIVAVLMSIGAKANPSVFGLEIGDTSVEQLNSQYEASAIGINKYTQGPMFEIAASQIDVEGLEEVTAIFSDSNQLVGVLADFPKSKFDYLYNVLGSKYQKVSERIPFVGDKSATFREGQTKITLEAPHMGFDMSLNYIHDELDQAFTSQSQAEEHEQRKRESSQL